MVDKKVTTNLRLKLSGKNGSFRNRENLQYKKTEDGSIESVHENKWKVQQFSRPSTGLSGVLFSVKTQYS